MGAVAHPSFLPSLSGAIGPAQRRDPAGGAVDWQPAPDNAGDGMSINRVLACMAGFYPQEADGRDALRHLRLSLGLLPSQLVLLRPADAGGRRFARLARRWRTGQRPDQAAGAGLCWLSAGLGALLAGVLAVLLAGLDLSDERHLAMLLLSIGLGAAAGAALGRRLARPAPPRRFDSSVRRQLAHGCWAVVAHGVPWASQAAVLAHLRASSIKWCAVAPRPARI